MVIASGFVYRANLSLLSEMQKTKEKFNNRLTFDQQKPIKALVDRSAAYPMRLPYFTNDNTAVCHECGSQRACENLLLR